MPSAQRAGCTTAGHKGQPHEEPAQLYPEPPDPQRPRAQRPEMKALVLTITLGLFAALQAQEPLSTRPETQDVSLQRGGGGVCLQVGGGQGRCLRRGRSRARSGQRCRSVLGEQAQLRER